MAWVALALLLVIAAGSLAAAADEAGETPRLADWVGPRRYYVGMKMEIGEEAVAKAAYELAYEHRALIRWIGPRGFHILATPRAAFDIGHDARVFHTFETAGPEPTVPPDKYLVSPSPHPGSYGVTLAESLQQYTNARVRELADQLTKQHGGRLMGLWTLRPGFAMQSSETAARAMAKDDRVACVWEETLMEGPEDHIEPLPPGFELSLPTPGPH